MEAALEGLKTTIDARLADVLAAPAVGPARLVDAMRYSVLAPAKRVRPILAMLAAEQAGGAPTAALDVAIAVELVHAASLILDDMPAMDDARERRGRPSNHRVWGEDTAMLAAVALLSTAFGVVGQAEPLSDAARVRAMSVLAAAVGPEGLTGGQEFDLRADGCDVLTADAIETTYRLKTAVLFGAAAELGAISVGASADAAAALSRFGVRLGLAFQSFDDLLDAHAAAAVVGKDVRQDIGKATLVTLLGREETERRARALVRAALDELAAIGGTDTSLGRFAVGLVDQLTAPLGRGAG